MLIERFFGAIVLAIGVSAFAWIAYRHDLTVTMPWWVLSVLGALSFYGLIWIYEKCK